MRTPPTRFAPILLCSFALAGCSTVPVVPHAIRCDASDKLLATTCATPQPLPEGATFSTLVDTALSDRKALRDCGLALDALRDTLNRCNQATDAFNQKIDAINSKNK